MQVRIRPLIHQKPGSTMTQSHNSSLAAIWPSKESTNGAIASSNPEPSAGRNGAQQKPKFLPRTKVSSSHEFHHRGRCEHLRDASFRMQDVLRFWCVVMYLQWTANDIIKTFLGETILPSKHQSNKSSAEPWRFPRDRDPPRPQIGDFQSLPPRQPHWRGP